MKALLEEFLNRHPFERAIGLDISEEMIREARKRLGNKAQWLMAQGEALPFENGQFDIVSSAFVLRSISNLPGLFYEIQRVLKPKGRFVLLELTRPKRTVLRLLYQIYLKAYLPLIGKIFSGSWHAYQFLASSIQKFYEVDEYVSLLKEAGLSPLLVRPMTFGVCTLVIAEKR